MISDKCVTSLSDVVCPLVLSLSTRWCGLRLFTASASLRIFHLCLQLWSLVDQKYKLHQFFSWHITKYAGAPIHEHIWAKLQIYFALYICQSFNFMWNLNFVHLNWLIIPNPLLISLWVFLKKKLNWGSFCCFSVCSHLSMFFH